MLQGIFSFCCSSKPLQVDEHHSEALEIVKARFLEAK